MSQWTLAIAATCVSGSMAIGTLAAADWKPADNPLMTRWAKDVSPEKVHGEYPRPQLVRAKWTNLNGLWDYAIVPKDQDQPEKFDGQILVPFPAESALSGVKKNVGPDNRLWYRRTIAAPKLADGQRLLLNFEAVDWQTEVWVNGQKVGEHRGGYEPFSLDVTDAVSGSGDQQLVVAVWDPTNDHWQPRGKQVRRPEGIYYTAVTGIWATVWLETVPAAHITSLKMTPELDKKRLRLAVAGSKAAAGAPVEAKVTLEGKQIASAKGKVGEAMTIAIADPQAWSPDRPILYDVDVTLDDSANDDDTAPAGDQVTSYFGLRSIAIGKAADGFNRLLLNGEPLFQFGPLDQGWWPDGLYTAPTDEALRSDIEITQKLGMNMLRKHVKVEPRRYYYHCDRLGMLVWQDMPSGDRGIGGSDPDLKRSPESAANYRREYQAMIDNLGNHPSIVVWVPFNEGWGQFDTNEILAWTQKYDPTRLVDGPSGWTDRGTGDMHDMHRYPGPGMPGPEEKRAVVLGEFGGLGLPVENHLWWNKRNWGYQNFKNKQDLQARYDQLIRQLRPLIGKGLSAAVYTQTTDVEGEVNGLMTYDRQVLKFDAEHMARLHKRLYGPPAIFRTTVLVPTSEKEPQTWRYTTSEPKGDWTAADFDDSGWSAGPGGLGEPSTPGTHVRTRWKSSDVWARRTFKLDKPAPKGLHLRLHHDEDVVVYLNGQQILKLTGYTTDYVDIELGKDALAALRDGENTLAVHCHQTGGGQYIDVGLVDIVELPAAEREQAKQP